MTEPTPVISVIVPTKNRAEMLERFLPTLADQTTAEPFEIIVVDNASTDNTAEVIARLSERWPYVRLIREERSGSAAACHAGAVAARGQLIMFVDDDMKAVPDLIAEHLKYHNSDGLVCVLGDVVSAESDHPFERMLAYIFDGGRQTLKAGTPVAVDYWSGNVSMPRSLYLELGGYDQKFSQLGYGKDIDFGNRLLKKGIPLVFEPRARTYHHFTERFEDRLKKAYRSGQGYGYVKSHYPDLPVPDVNEVHTLIPDRLVLPACRMAALILEPFDRGKGVPMKPLAYVYDLGIRTATSRGLTNYLKSGEQAAANGSKK